MRTWILNALLAVVSLASVAFASEYQLPKLPEGLEAKVLVNAPVVSEVTSVAASPDGRKVYVGSQPSACDRGKWGDVKLFWDTDGDGTYDKQTVFAPEMAGAQGMICVGDTVYVVHSPWLTMLRDTNGDGVADERKNLIVGLGPEFTGGLHDHTCTGCVLAMDGWIYIAIGDKGALTPTGIDGKKVQVNGGGVIRVRPDGTDIEVFALGTRNTMDIGVDTELNAFTRDNTNDGGGWNVRSTHILQGAQYGYPNLFKNYVEEMLPCMVDHGGGSPCGCVYYDEVGLRPEDRGKFYFCDWGRAIVYRYQLKRKGATYEMQQEEWIKPTGPFRCVDIQPDALGYLYVADWGRGGWGKGPQAGAVIKVCSTGFKPTLTVPDFKKLDPAGLVAQLASPSQMLRILAQQELLTRGEAALPLLQAVMEGGNDVPRVQRLFALWTFKQIAGVKATAALLKLSEKPEFREHALRAITDRKGELESVTPEPFLTALKDADPFVRVQGVIGLTRLGTPREARSNGSENYCGPAPLPHDAGKTVLNRDKIATGLAEALGDSELQVRHLAQRGLRAMEAWEASIQAAEKGSELASQFAFVALREIYSDEGSDALIALTKRVQGDRKAEAVKALGRLARKEADWKGNWWGTQPNTVGPFQKPTVWSSSDKLGTAVRSFLNDADEKVALAALWSLACMRDDEAASQLTKMIDDPRPNVRNAAVDTLIATRPAGGAPMLAKLVLDTKLSADKRKAALDALSRSKTAEADQSIVELALKLEELIKDKAQDTDGLLPLSRRALANARNDAAVPGLKTIVMNAALNPEVRAAAANALSGVRSKGSDEVLTSLMNDPDPELVSLALKNVDYHGSVRPEKVRPFLTHKEEKVRVAAVIALGRLKDETSVETIAKLLNQPPMQAVAIEALKNISPLKCNEPVIISTVESIASSIDAGEFESPKLEESASAVARQWIAAQQLNEEQRKKLRARVGGGSGILDFWFIMGPFLTDGAKAFEKEYEIEKVKPEEIAAAVGREGHENLKWTPYQSLEADGRVAFDKIFSTSADGAAFAYCEVNAPKESKVTLLFGSDDSLSLWLNGERVFHKDYNRGFTADQDKIPVTLKAGKNILMAKVVNHGGGWELGGRIEGLAPVKKPGKVALAREALVAEAMQRTGDVAKGDALFHDAKRGQCINCHTVNGVGGKVGPDLSSIGATKERRYLIDSVLEPSKDLAQGFVPMLVQLNSGKVLNGSLLSETADGFDLMMADGNRETIKNSDVKKKINTKQSLMPEGLANTMTKDEFVDLITYISSLKK